MLHNVIILPCFSYLTKKVMFAIFLCLFLEVTLHLWLFGIICCSPWYCHCTATITLNSPLLAEAVCCWDEPIRGQDRCATVQVTGEVEADLPWPLPFHGINSTHNTWSCWWIHLYEGGISTSWGGQRDGYLYIYIKEFTLAVLSVID